MVKHDDWRSAAPFFEVVAAKLQGPSPGPETLAWPPNYHYGGSPFRARGPLLGTKLLGRGPTRRSPLTSFFSSQHHSFLRSSSYISSCSLSLDRLTNIFFCLYRFPSIRPAFINIFVRVLLWKKQKFIYKRIKSLVRLKEEEI